ncbi:MAG: FecR domain-containing protein [Rhodoferax sp.]|nr:FecR domain-containing protein [Rhodoferax sp.]
MHLRHIAFCLLLTGALSAWADEAPIGYVKTLSGDASVTTGKNKVAAQLGTPLFQGSQLRTGAKSSMGVTFKDDTVMSFGPDTDLTVDEYLYAPSQGKLKLGSKLVKGSLNYVSGAIAKLQPDAVSVKTPTGTIGVRGTQFVVTVEP